MKSKPDVFVIVPPPVYKDGFGAVNTTLTNKVVPSLVPPIAKECGLSDQQIINLHDVMGGEKLDKPFYYCSGRHCDGYHPVDEGQDVMAKTIMEHVLAFYKANPKGRLSEPAQPPAGQKKQPAKPAASQEGLLEVSQDVSQELF